MFPDIWGSSQIPEKLFFATQLGKQRWSNYRKSWDTSPKWITESSWRKLLPLPQINSVQKLFPLFHFLAPSSLLLPSYFLLSWITRSPAFRQSKEYLHLEEPGKLNSHKLIQLHWVPGASTWGKRRGHSPSWGRGAPSDGWVSELEPGEGDTCERRGIWAKWEDTCVGVGVTTDVRDWLHAGIDPVSKYNKNHCNSTLFTIGHGILTGRENTSMKLIVGWKDQWEVMASNTSKSREMWMHVHLAVE